jgi:hypothetical protein
MKKLVVLSFAFFTMFSASIFTVAQNKEVSTEITQKRIEIENYYDKIELNLVRVTDSLLMAKDELIKEKEATYNDFQKAKIYYDNYSLLERHRKKVTKISGESDLKKFSKTFEVNNLKVVYITSNIVIFECEQANIRFIEIKKNEIDSEKKKIKLLENTEKKNNPIELTESDLFYCVEARDAHSHFNALQSIEVKIKINENRILDLNKMDIKNARRIDLGKINKFENEYKKYTSDLIDYDTRYALAKKNDDKLRLEYEKKLSKYEQDLSAYDNYKLTKSEALKVFNLIKKNFRNPSSAVLTSFGLERLTADIYKDKWPCVRCLRLGIRAQNGFGGYTTDMFNVLWDGKNVIHFKEEGGMWLPSMYLDGVVCDGKMVSKPNIPDYELPSLKRNKPIEPSLKIDFSIKQEQIDQILQ